MISIVQKNRWSVFKKTFLLCVLVVHRAFAGGGGGGMIVYDPTNWIQNVLYSQLHGHHDCELIK